MNDIDKLLNQIRNKYGELEVENRQLRDIISNKNNHVKNNKDFNKLLEERLEIIEDVIATLCYMLESEYKYSNILYEHELYKSHTKSILSNELSLREMVKIISMNEDIDRISEIVDNILIETGRFYMSGETWLYRYDEDIKSYNILYYKLVKVTNDETYYAKDMNDNRITDNLDSEEDVFNVLNEKYKHSPIVSKISEETE